jgi:hypothetical protein
MTISFSCSVLKGPLKKCQHILREILKRKGSQYFLAPVDPVKENLPDYYQVVKDPVDLSSIHKALDLGFYSYDVDGTPAHHRVAQDVSQVWQNALQYNPDGNLVSQSAKDLKAFADEQFQKIAAEESDVSGGPGTILRQLVVDNYLFLDEEGRTLLPEVLHQRERQGTYIQGRLVPVVPTSSGGNSADATYSLRVNQLHFELVDNKDTVDLQVWVRSSTSWALLLKPAGGWSVRGTTWLFNQLVYELSKKYVMENTQNLQYEKLLRFVLKAIGTSNRTYGRVDESRVRKALVDYAENIVLCVEQITQAEGGGKLGHKESIKMTRRLLAEAEKDRSNAMLETLKRSSSKSNVVPKESLAVCGALCSVISKVELEAVRSAALKDTKVPVKKETEPKKSTGRKSLAVAPEPAADNAGEDQGGEEAEEKQGYWERDDDGNRRWVDTTSGSSAAKSGRKRKMNEDGEAAPAQRRVKHILRESPTVPQEGGLAKVLFDDQQWYVGRLTGFSEGKWHILFSDGDEDHVAIPDPDVVLLPPVPILMQALDEAYDEVKHGLKILLGMANTPAALAERADEIKKAVGMMRRNLKECLNRTTTGRSKEGEGSVHEVRENFLNRVKARLVYSERMLTEDQWKEVVDHAMALARELDGPDEVPAAKSKKGAGKSKDSEKSKAAEAGKGASAADTGKGAGKANKGSDLGKTPSKAVKFEEHSDEKVKTEAGGEDDGAGEAGKQLKKRGRKPKSMLESPAQAEEGSTSTPIKGEEMQEDGEDMHQAKPKGSAKRTPKTPKAAPADAPEAETKTPVTSSRKGRKGQDKSAEAGAAQTKGDTEMTDASGEVPEWKGCPPWLYMNANVEVLWENDWWKVIRLYSIRRLHVFYPTFAFMCLWPIWSPVWRRNQSLHTAYISHQCQNHSVSQIFSCNQAAFQQCLKS